MREGKKTWETRPKTVGPVLFPSSPISSGGAKRLCGTFRSEKIFLKEKHMILRILAGAVLGGGVGFLVGYLSNRCGAHG